jgi:hypothetical protein
VIKNEMSYPCKPISHQNEVIEGRTLTNLDRFSPQNYEALRSLHHKSRKLVTQDPLNLICLLDLDADPDRVHRGFDKTRSFSFLEIVSGLRRTSLRRSVLCAERISDRFIVISLVAFAPAFDFWLVMSFYHLCGTDYTQYAAIGIVCHLRREVLQSQCRGQRRPHGSEVWPQNIRLTTFVSISVDSSTDRG